MPPRPVHLDIYRYYGQSGVTYLNREPKKSPSHGHVEVDFSSGQVYIDNTPVRLPTWKRNKCAISKWTYSLPRRSFTPNRRPKRQLYQIFFS